MWEEIELHLKLAEEELSSAFLLLENNKLRDAISELITQCFMLLKHYSLQMT